MARLDQHHRRRRGRVAGRAEERDHHRLRARRADRKGVLGVRRASASPPSITIPSVSRSPRNIATRSTCRCVRQADVLAAAGAGSAADLHLRRRSRSLQRRISHVRAAFPAGKSCPRADQRCAQVLMQMDADYFLRETFESSVAMGKEWPAVLPRSGQGKVYREFRRRDQSGSRSSRSGGRRVRRRRESSPLRRGRIAEAIEPWSATYPDAHRGDTRDHDHATQQRAG